MPMTLAEAMALAVLRGDMVAAYALADRLQEERAADPAAQAMAQAATRSAGPARCHDVYQWPEFLAFARRLGFMWDLSTRDVVIRMPLDGLVEIEHNYVGTDGPPAGTPIDTTTAHNRVRRTRIPARPYDDEPPAAEGR